MNKIDANTSAKRNSSGTRALKLALLASIAGSALGQGLLPVSATDIAVPRMYAKAPPMAVSPVYDWSGFYAGVHAGYDWGRARVVDNGVLTESGVPMNGAVGGLLAGYNWQTGAFVLGLEADFGAAALQGHGAAKALPPTVVPNEYDVNLTANARGRVGVAVLPQTLIYAAGGFAMAEFKFRESNAPDLISKRLTGWTVGAGVDQVLAKNLIGRVEYLYADYGNKNFAVAPGDIYNIGFKTQTLRGALIAKFDADTMQGPNGKAFAMAAAPASWTGFYFGGDFGGAIQSGKTISNFFEHIDGGDAGFDNNAQGRALHGTSSIGGAHAGVNWQFAPAWLIGLEGDWQWTHQKTAFCRQTDVNSVACSDNDNGFANLSGEIRSIGTVRGRLGATVDRVMFYGTGGVAFADVRTSLGLICPTFCGQNDAISTTQDSSKMKTGWVAGAGVETMLDRNWIVRAEYLHADLGSVSNTLSIPSAICASGSPCGLSWSRQLHTDIVRAGVSYKFGT